MPPASSSVDKIRAIDADRNGKLSAAEHEAGSRSMFTRTDANQDGSVDAAEIRAAREALMGKRDGEWAARRRRSVVVSRWT